MKPGSVLALPVGVLLLLIWRSTIRENLEREARFSPRAARLLERRGLLGNLFATVAGLVYLLLSAMRRGALRLARRSALGRTLVAEALVQSIARANEGQDDQTGLSELDADLRKPWVRGEVFITSAVEEELKELRDRLEGQEVVLLKASRGVAMEGILPLLEADFAAESSPGEED